MIKSVDELDFNKNFILSAINLAFLGYYGTGRIKMDPHQFLARRNIFQ